MPEPIIPPHLEGGLTRYLEDGIPPGSFLEAVLSNDLKEACSRGDSESLAGLVDLVCWLYNHAPMNCWGSPERVRDWIAAAETARRSA